MRLKARIVIVILLACPCFIFSAFAATQTPQAWTTNVVSGEFPSERAALSAVHALGGKYALAERVENVAQTGTAVTYTYGANPQDPIVGSWYKYTMQYAPSEYSSEAAAISAAKSELDKNSPTCPATEVNPFTPWRKERSWYNGENDIERRDYDIVEYYTGSPCITQLLRATAWRYRVIECPQYMNWNNFDKACVAKGIVQISTRPMVCSPNELQHNPCNVSTGDKYQSETDFSLSWLTFDRHYHSSHSVPNSVLGPGWTHVLDQRLQIAGTSYAGLVLPSGDILPFQNFEAIDGSGWRIVPIATGIYEVRKPTQTLRFQSGRLIEIDDKDGSLITLQYDESGRLATALHSGGRSLEFVYGATSYPEKWFLTSIKGDDITLVEYSYDSAGRLEFVKYPDAVSRRYHYEDSAYPNHLTGITDEVNQRYSTYAYDADGLVALSEHAGGVFRGEFSYRADGVTVFTDPSGRSQIFQFTGDGAYRKVTGISDVTGAQSIVYALESADFRRRPVSRLDKRGAQITYSYADITDPVFGSVRLTTTNEAIGATQARTTQDWREQATGRLLKTAALGRETVYQRNARGQPTAVTMKDANTTAIRTTTTAYCEQVGVDLGGCPLLGLATSINGPRTDVNDTTTYTYYPTGDATCATAPTTCPHRKGDLWKVTNALGQVTETLRYDGAGRVLSVKDANGVITDLEYHPRGWLTARKVRGTDDASEADDQVTRIEYWPTGLVKQVTQPDGAFTAYEYDAAHRLVAIADNAGNRIEYLLDNAGNRIQENTQDAGGNLKHTLSRLYNQLGQLATVADAQANPTDFGYDANGNTTSVTDTFGRETRNEYDPLNRLKRTLQDVGGIAAETTFEYDALDNLTKVTDPKGLDTTYTYNGLGDLLQLSSPDTGTTSYTYDSAGNRATQTDARGVTTDYSYDALNRLTAISYPDSSLNVAYTYDIAPPVCAAGETFAVGRLAAMTDGSGSTQYCYDRFGHLVRKVQTTHGQVFQLRYAYTKSGQLQHMVYPDGAVVDYVRNTQGNITEVGVARAGYPREVLLHQASYHPFGPVAAWTYGNGRTMLRPLDQDYRPLAVEDPSTGGLSLGFGFDAVGHLTQLSSGSPPPISFVYDALGRLTETRDGPTQAATDTYSYDATGNRTAHTTAAGTSAYGYPANSHRLTDVAGVIRAYDAAGNTLNIGAKEFVYNDANRLSQVKQASVAVMNYAYNGRGEQVRKHIGTSNTYTLYDEAGHWVGDYDSAGNALQQALWMDDLPVGLVANNNQLHYLQPDHLGTPRTVIEVARNVPVWTWDLKGEAFGNTAPDQNPDGDAQAFVFDMRFPGQRLDAASGLNYNYFRDYDKDAGRYLQSDPIGLDGGVSTYSYVGASPLMWNDSFGLVRWDGTALPASAGGILAVGAFVFDLKSQCVNGRRAQVLVRAWGAGVGVGVKGLPLVNATSGNVSLEDHLPDIYPSNFNGLFVTVGGGLEFGNWGAGCTGYQIGSIGTPAVTKGSAFCSVGGGGFTAGGTYLFGKSTLVGLKWEKCNQCEPIDTPF